MVGRILAALLLLSTACNNTPEGVEMSATVMGARGLVTSPNQLAGSPQGSSVVAENVVVARPGIYETRRGYSYFADRFPGSNMESVTEFKGVTIGWGGGRLAYFDPDGEAWSIYGYADPAVSAVTHTVNAGYTDILPIISMSGPVLVGNGTVTIVVETDDMGGEWFTWSSTAGVQNATPQVFESAQTVVLFTDTGINTGLSVTWGEENYGPGDTYTFTLTGGSTGTTYLAPFGPLKEPDGSLLRGRVRFHETGGCLYFTTSKGVFRLEDPFGMPMLSGISQGLIGTAALTGTSGFLVAGQSVAYRETWSKRTPEGRIIEGAPSGRVTVYNTITASGTITFSASSGTTTQTINGATAFTQTTGTDAQRATALAAAINSSVDPLISGIVTASANAGVVTISAIAYGAAANAITLAVTGTGVTRSGANLTGGGATRNVSHTIPIPRDLPPDAFLRVWRTSSYPNAVGPGEDYSQVHEKSLTDMAAGATEYTFTDITPDAIRGDAAYFSANLGDGLIASKFRPPLASNILTFRDSTVYVGATGPENVSMTLLSVTPFTTSLVGLAFRFGTGAPELYTGTTSTGPLSDGQFTVYTSGTPSQNIEQTAQSLVRAINRYPDGRLRAAYLSDDNGTPGSFMVEARELDEPQFVVQALGTTLPWFPALKTTAVATISGRDGSGHVSVTTTSPHGLTVDQMISVQANPTPPYNSGTKTVSSVSSDTQFSYFDPGPTSAVSGTVAYQTTTVDLQSEQQGGPSFIAWTPLGEPDAVPVLNYVNVGRTENSVLSELMLGNSLYLTKADGLFRLSGDVPSTFALDQVDTTVSFIGPYASFTLGGNAYALTTEGLKVWTETGKPQPMDIGVSKDILDLTVQNRAAVDKYAFATNYESERTMLLWMPSAPDSEHADFAYRYNYLTEAWTKELTPALCAVVSPTKDKLIIGSDRETGAVLLERKDRKATDYSDPDDEAIPSKVTYSPQMGSDPSLGKNFNRMKYFMDPESPMPTTIGVGFHTDWVPTPTEFPIPVAHARGTTFETLVDGQHKRGTRLYVTVKHAVAGEKLSLLGYSVTFYEHTLGSA